MLEEMSSKNCEMVRLECQSLNSLVKVFSEWQDQISAEEIDFTSLDFDLNSDDYVESERVAGVSGSMPRPVIGGPTP